MKKSALFFCAGMLLLSLAACGNSNGGESGQGSSGTVSSPAPAESGSAQPEGSSEAGNASGVHDYTQGWTEEMEAVRAAVVDALGENYLPDMALTPDLLEAAFGITPDMYEDYMAEMPMISANVDTLLIIRAKDDKVDEVEQALNAYRDAKISDTMQYPMNIGKIQASRVEKIGNYLCFVQLGADVMDVMEQGDEAVIEYCQAENDRVIEILRQNLE